MAKNILIVDDNPEDLEHYKRLLHSADGDYEVYTALSGKQAIELFKQHSMDCTFIDYHLPEMSGLSILELLQAQAPTQVLALIILTGEHNQTVQAEAARKGALDFMVKDVKTTPEQVEAVIEKAMSWANSLSESSGMVAKNE